MLDEEVISETLEALSDRRAASTRSREIRALKGVRGVSDGEVARIAAATWKQGAIDIDRDRSALDRLFAAAYEDGLVAVALVAAALPDEPEAALDIGSSWLDRVDDPFTADALGWLVLGPATLACQRPVESLVMMGQASEHECARRATVMAGLAMTPEPLQGPAAAALRERLGERQVRFVEEALSEGLATLMDGFVRDASPTVRKSIRRVLRAWAKADPHGAVAWANAVRGGIPRMFGDELARARRKVAAS